MSSSVSGSRSPAPPEEGPTDEELAKRVQRGDRAAFARLVRRYLRPVHAIASSFLREQADVEDVAQETFLDALDRIETYDSDRPFAPWLYQIARNAARQRIERRSRREVAPVPEEGLAHDSAGPEEELERAEVRRRLRTAVAGLPERQRTVFRLLDVEGFSADEVAGMLGLTAGTIRSHLSRARSALRDVLAPWLQRGEEV